VKTEQQQKRIESAVRAMQFAIPGKVEPGTVILLDASQREDRERWIEGTVLGPNDRNTAHLDVRDAEGRLWVAHWSNTRLLPQALYYWPTQSGGFVTACCLEHAKSAATYQREELDGVEPIDDADHEAGDSCDECGSEE
jgi:hypothetical protein